MAVSEQIAVRKKRKALELLNQNRVGEARKIYEDLLRHDAGDAESWLMLGVVVGRGGDADRAGQCVQRSLEVDPGFAEAWFGYGQVLEMQGRIDDAYSAYQHALSIQPRLSEAHAALGRICIEERSLFRDAIDHFRAALDAGTFHTEIMIAYMITGVRLKVAYGEALRYGGENAEAAKVFESALNEYPDNPDLLHKLGTAYIRLSQLDAARRTIDRGIEVAPDSLPLRISEVELLCLEKRFDEAVEISRALFDAVPDNVQVVLSHAQLCDRAGNIGAVITRLESMLHDGKMSAREQVNSCFELGRLYDAQQEYDDAFTWYRRGNELRRTGYDQSAADEAVSALIEGCSREILANASHADNTDRRPVFIVGMPRSGSSLVEQILASHPEVYGAGELPELGYLLGKNSRRDSGQSSSNKCSEFTVVELNTIANRYLKHLDAISAGERYVTDKMLNNIFHIGAISLLFPKARIIHCRRNPADTCLSCYFHNFTGFHPYTNDLESLASFYRNYRRLMAHWKEAIALPMLEIDYEALVADQAAQTRRLLEFLELDWDDRCLQYHKSRRATLTASRDQVNRPIYTSSVARWKHYKKHIGPLIELLDSSDR